MELLVLCLPRSLFTNKNTKPPPYVRRHILLRGAQILVYTKVVLNVLGGGGKLLGIIYALCIRMVFEVAAVAQLMTSNSILRTPLILSTIGFFWQKCILGLSDVVVGWIEAHLA